MQLQPEAQVGSRAVVGRYLGGLFEHRECDLRCASFGAQTRPKDGDQDCPHGADGRKRTDTEDDPVVGVARSLGLAHDFHL